MRVVFAGTPEFAVPVLEALADAGHEIVLVLTQPDRPAGRGLGRVTSPVKRSALRRRLAVFQPQTLKDPAAQDRIRAAGAEIMVVAAYGLILPQAVLDIPARGALNVHASLLPRWRGAAPIQRAILAGDRVTGISIMQMDAGLDTGPVLLRESIPIASEATAGTLHDELAALGARLIVAALAGLVRGDLAPTPQPQEGVTYARKIEKAEARVDWMCNAEEIERQVRAFNPFPGATTILGGVEIKLWRAAALPGGQGAPGAVLRVTPEGVDVGCGAGALRVLELQRAGGKRLAAADFLRGFAVRPGDRFELRGPAPD
jgi:methionyl-tRNA formyltransferase